MSQIKSAKESDVKFGLTIDGKSLDFSLKNDIEKPFFERAINCDSAICCRSSPKQKALVIRLLKGETGKTMLAIGDGANDVCMLQEADIGVGISEALTLFREMVLEGVQPDGFTMVCLLSACAELGALALGRRAHVYILKIGLSVNLRVDNALLDLYAKCGSIRLLLFLVEGYSRVVYCNDPDHLEEAVKLNYRGNYVSTTKYSAANFIPKSLFEQFRRVANIYFLVVACVSFSPLAPYSSLSILAPLIVVIGATMAKEGVEDWRRRKQDIEANNRKVKVYDCNNTFCETNWKKVRVGDIVKVCKDEYFPADLVLLSTSYEDGICYVETMNLDGETNLKLKYALDVTSHLHDEKFFKEFRAVIECEDPNEKLYSFIGTLSYGGKKYPLSIQHLLLRGSKLKNTEYVFGIAIFTGHDTKVMQNATHPPSKRSKIEKKMDKIIYLLFSTLALIAFVGSLFFGIETKKDFSGGKLRRWYLRPDDTTVFYDPKRPSLSAFFHFLTALMLYGYLIPISLYISIEIVKVLQSIFINQDLDMYDKETGKPARARTSNLNEELGQVAIILSDKTGTLTCNSMEFVKCSIAGTAYGRGMTEVERSLARRRGDPLPETGYDVQGHEAEKSVRGFNFRDERIMNGQWLNEPHWDIIQKFFRVLAICHTAIPEENKQSGEIMYEAESPDEAAFLIAAKEIGFKFKRVTQTSISLCELVENGKMEDRDYERLQVLEFNTSRKRMSVIIRNKEKKLLLLSKGADSVMFGRLSKDGRSFESQTKDHIKKYAEAGLRILICYFFYKNIAFGFTLFWFEAHASFSGQPAYNDWYMSFYNVFFTSLPVIALGVFDQDVSATLCLKYPFLYLEGLENILFSWPRILAWMFNGFLTSIIIFFLTTKSMIKQAFRRDGQVVDYEVLGVTMYSCVVWAVNCQMAISVNYFTWIHHFFIWGSIAFWYIFLVIYGYLPPEMSTTAYRAFVEECAPSVLYWLVTLLAVICTLLPYFSFRAFQTRFKPMYHDTIQRREYEGLEAELPRRVRKKLHLRKTLMQRNS
nr:putative phospholipid-transporting atpase 8 [Quercus suber]